MRPKRDIDIRPRFGAFGSSITCQLSFQFGSFTRSGSFGGRTCFPTGDVSRFSVFIVSLSLLVERLGVVVKFFNLSWLSDDFVGRITGSDTLL